MMLLIDADRNSETGWQGFDFVLNRSVTSPTTTTLEKNTAGWSWEKATQIAYRVEANQLHIAIPRKAMNLTKGNAPLAFDFKWVDNWRKPGDIMDFYISGDVAPEGRFKYRYKAE
jgi:hypothetical protein